MTPCFYIFGYERTLLLRNCIASVEQFAPTAEIVVVDDASRSESMNELLASVARTHRVIRKARSDRSGDRHGGLYSSMNIALEDATTSGRSCVVLMQDDMQLLRSAESELEKAVALLNADEYCVQVTLAFHKRLQGGPKTFDRAVGAFRHGTLALTDTGLTSVDRLNQYDLRFGPTERAHSDLAAAQDCHTLGVQNPVMGYVPWVPVFRRGRRRGRSAAPSCDSGLLLRPMSDDQVSALVRRPRGQLPFHEEWCVPNGWSALTPYIYGGGYRDWIANYSQHLVKGGTGRVWPGHTRVRRK